MLVFRLAKSEKTHGEETKSVGREYQACVRSRQLALLTHRAHPTAAADLDDKGGAFQILPTTGDHFKIGRGIGKSK